MDGVVRLGCVQLLTRFPIMGTDSLQIITFQILGLYKQDLSVPLKFCRLKSSTALTALLGLSLACICPFSPNDLFNLFFEISKFSPLI